MSIKIKNLKHVYDPDTPYELEALSDINLSIEDGEIIGLIGHTGSGKSTLMQHLNGLLRPSDGVIEIEGMTITKNKQNLRKLREKVGLVFQYPEYQLFEETVKKDVAFGPKNVGVSEEDIQSVVTNALSHVGLNVDEIGDKAPFELSGGQKRKVAIAGVLAMKPRVLILDEPTAGLDPKSRDELLHHIKMLHEKEKMTIIFVTHSMEDVARLASRLVVMHKSKIVYDDTPREVFKHSEHLQTIGLDVPELTKLIYKLNERGFNIDENLITFEEVKEAIMNRLGEK